MMLLSSPMQAANAAGYGGLTDEQKAVAEAWRIVDSIVAGWNECEVEPHEYDAGTWGPPAAEDLLGDYREWRKP